MTDTNDTPAVPGTAPVPGQPRPRRRKAINRPQGAELKGHRPGTKRALVVALLTGEGATFEGVQDAIAEAFPGGEWDARTAYEGITLISSLLGYALTEDPETGIIRASYEAA